MNKLVLCAVALVVGTTGLRADVFSFSYSGTGVSVSGTLTATQLGLGSYTVTDISGSRNGTLFDASPTGAGIFTFGGPLDSSGWLAFSVGSSGVLDTVTFSDANFAELGGKGVGLSTGNNFSITRSLPEAGTVSLLITMGLGVWLLTRKLPCKRRG